MSKQIELEIVAAFLLTIIHFIVEVNTDITCPTDQCEVCNSTTYCTKCIEGYHNGQFDNKYYANCSLKCQPSCKECSSYNLCTECNPGYFHNVSTRDCRLKCSKGCINDTCKDSGGSCSCKSGYAGITCSVCDDGLYGSNCSLPCSAGCNEKCNRTDGSCSCKSGYTGTECEICVNGRFGLDCSQNCSFGCSNDSCNDTSGSCVCKHGFAGDMCNSCIGGLYGTNCSINCSHGCNNMCNGTDGSCSCREGFRGATCDACADGMYGPNCTLSCSTGCVSDACDYKDGSCSCEYRYSGMTCDSCVDGLYGLDCLFNCSIGCTDGVCNMSNGTCVCKNGFIGEICDNCAGGLYGQDCSLNCSTGCNNSMCNTSDGSCSCKYGFSGDSCDRCVTGHYGQDCSLICALGCTEGTCNQSDGSCACNDGFTGSNCSSKCSPTCYNGKCDKLDGRCDACVEQYYGVNCEHRCLRYCTDNSCDDDTGYCKKGCIDGQYGQQCEDICPSNCFRCSGEDQCSQCKAGFYGQICGKTCPINCADSACNTDSGTCSRGCIINKYGHFCDHTCGSHCLSKDEKLSTKCSHTNGTCIYGCESGFYGYKCNLYCSGTCRNDTCERLTGNCLLGCIGDYTGSTCSEDKTFYDGNSNDGNVSVGAIAGGVVGVLVTAAIIIVVVFLWRRRQTGITLKKDYADDVGGDNNKARGSLYKSASLILPDEVSDANVMQINRNPTGPPQQMHMSTLYPTSTVVSVENGPDAKEIKRPQYNTVHYSVERRKKVEKLAEYVAKKNTSDFEEEFQELPDGLIKPYAESQKPENMAKNRYRRIYPYDEYRVKLTEPGTDYINASYIDGFNQPKSYIACQGPTTDHFVLFWRMVWQENVEQIVMVTKLEEDGVNKCHKYWPDAGESVYYGDVMVTCHSDDKYADYTVRSFTVYKDSISRPLHHIHFTAWPDKGVPDDITCLIEFRQKVNSTQVTLNRPTIVHCSAGVGRTGTYIALDILTKQGETTQAVDIFMCVVNMRQNRPYMVQTVEQYEYLHHAVVHSLTTDCQTIPADKFQEYTAVLDNNDDDDDMAHIFELHTKVDMKTDEEIKAIDRNKTQTKANRAGADVPGDLHRPVLSLGNITGSGNYINAVYINSFRTQDRYIVAQTPLPDTVEDFVTLAFQTKCPCIVSMENLDTLQNEDAGSYIPADNQDLVMNTLQVTSVKGDTTPYCLLRKIIVKDTKEEELTVHHFQYTQWNKLQNVPDDPKTFLQMIKDVENIANNTEDGRPIIVHCLDGGGKSGLFCAVSMLIQKMEVEHEVSVVNTVKHVQSRRANAIPNKEQYMFCHRAVSSYLLTLSEYSQLFAEDMKISN